MPPISRHQLLVTAPTLEKAISQVEEFFGNTMLVRYDRIEFEYEKSLSSRDPEFSQAVAEGIKINRSTLDRFIREFEKTGFKSIQDLHNIECGYQSKLLHIITHFLDGFIGIDSAFYNLHEDSHWVTDTVMREIREMSLPYWIIFIQCYSDSPEKVSLVQT